MTTTASQTPNPQEQGHPPGGVPGAHGPDSAAQAGHGGAHGGHAGMAPTPRFAWEKKPGDKGYKGFDAEKMEEDIYMKYIRQQHERGSSFAGLHNALTYATWLRNEMWGNIDDEVQREMAMSHVTAVEAVTKPRQMGISDRNYRLGKVVWFDEVLLYRTNYDSNPPGPFNKWWDYGNSKTNKPPANIPGHHMKEGRDYLVYHMPITGGAVVDADTIEHFKQFVPPNITDEQNKKEFAERLARDKMWDTAADNYAGNCAYRMNRGEAEKWSGAIEPAVLMDQKTGTTDELAFADFKDMFRDQAESEKRRVERELVGMPEGPQREKLLDEQDDINAYLYTLAHREDEGLRHVVGDDWRKKTVKSQFTTINSVGRLLLQKLLPGTAVALSRSRRFQARAARIVGVELDEDGRITENSVVVSRLSEAIEYQELIMCALLDRSGIEKEQNGEVLKKVQKQLDVYRDYLGLNRIELDLEVDARGKLWRETQQDKLKAKGVLVQKGKNLVARVTSGANVGEEEIDHDPGEAPKQSEQEEEMLDSHGFPLNLGGGGGASSDDEEAVKHRATVARQQQNQADFVANKKKEEEEKKRQEREARGRPADSDVQKSYYEIQTQLMYDKHKRKYPPPTWKHTKKEWNSEPPVRKEKIWGHYLNRKALDEITNKIMRKNENFWDDLGEDVVPPENVDDDVEEEDVKE